ncbi:hypothetical protein [Tsukamurella tyrosinosolvens]|uniref:hypothetical protein n=1 Tax=Tsukamurella tyrosinosolvens TaxID=57704 RepID=UPI0012E9247C|nr:hypothetical protein [Tsukamurella tyrosinosolvens]
MTRPTRCVCGHRSPSHALHLRHAHTCSEERARASAFIAAVGSDDFTSYFDTYPEEVR